MMKLLSLAWGGFSGAPLVAALILATLYFGGRQIITERNASLRQEGRQACIGEWEKENLIQQRNAALADLRAAVAQQSAIDVLNMELKTNEATLQKELAGLRAAAVGADERCLSDGVRELATGGVRPGAGDKGGGGGSQAGADRKSVRPKAP